ncbi:MAG: sugar ABC transporter substrate-binding protein, partial [Caldilineaceae bacterium]|nr:sugar ABC transporter substrate-binding protein [Caldilineaceae bacterium]
MLQRKMVVLIGIMVLFSMILSACTTVAPAAQPAAPAADAGEASWWQTAAQAAGCEGVTLRGVSESTPPTRFAAEVLAPAFEAASGIKVELEPTSWDEMYSKAINDMQAGT